MADNKTPLLLQTLSPAPDQYDARHLTYPDLKDVIDEFYAHEYENLEEWNIGKGESSDVQSNSYRKYLLLSAHKLQEALSHEEKLLWTKRYTETSIALYGSPRPEEVVSIARSELKALTRAAAHTDSRDDSYKDVFARYESLSQARHLGNGSTEDTAQKCQQILPEVRSYMLKRHAAAMDVFERYAGSDQLSVRQVLQLYKMALRQLAEEEPSWNEWSLRLHDSAHLSVLAARKTIKVGRHIPPLTLKRAQSLFVHEALVHVQRSINGAKLDSSLATGLPGYIRAEEGLAILAEASLLGHIPHRVNDRYIDTALALGIDGNPPMSRPELFTFAFSRALLRAKSHNDPYDESLLRRTVWQHVNRLYRGTLGNRYVGVLTRDIVYYDGLKEVVEYINSSSGSLEEVMDFLLQGKFHPCIDEHVSFIHTVTNS